MTTALIKALRLLGQFWLEELKPADLPLIQALPELVETLPNLDAAELTNLAVEYQRLFGFNLPPYESVFLDPSAMLMAPATERVQGLYRQAGWSPPVGLRTGAPDHLGLELLALADWLEHGQADQARRLQTDHLALWVPVCIITLRRLDPQPFYARLAELTLDLLLSLLPAEPVAAAVDPFPDLPPPPKFRGSEENWPATDAPALESAQWPDLEEAEPEMQSGQRRFLKQLLGPRQAGLYLTRHDIAGLSRALELPAAMGDRYRMLETLFRSANQYELLPALGQQLVQLSAGEEAAYEALAGEYPAWTPYASAWQKRLAAARTLLTKFVARPAS